MPLKEEVIAQFDTRNKDARWALESIFTWFGDFWFDIKYKTDTRRVIDPNRGLRYAPTKANPFIKLMNNLTFPPESVFVDLGAGKGRPVLIASGYGFKKVVGVEYSPILCEIARKNIAAYREKTGNATEMEIIESDVIDYEVRNDENVFFLFNPFDGNVLDRVMGNIGRSLEKNPRKIWLIYHLPIWHKIVMRQGSFVKEKEFTLGANPWFVYVSRD